jgi:hypothetical protein
MKRLILVLALGLTGLAISELASGQGTETKKTTQKNLDQIVAPGLNSTR